MFLTNQRRKWMTRSEFLYHCHKQMIESLAYKYWMENPIVDFNELLSESNYSFCLALQSFNPAISTFTTYLYIKISRRLSNLIIKTQKRNEKYISVEEGGKYELSFERESHFHLMIEKLSDDAKFILNIIFRRLNFSGRQRKKSKIITIKSLVKDARKRGMSRKNAEISIKEIQKCISRL